MGAERAGGASGRAGRADFAPMEDHEVGKEGPAIFRPHFHEVLLYLDGAGVLSESEPVREARAVGIDDDALFAIALA